MWTSSRAGSEPAGGRGAGRAPRARRAARLCGQRGSQTVELALATPFVVLALVVVVQAAVLAADAVAAQSVAAQAARLAAVTDDAAVHEAVRAAGGRRSITLALDPPSPLRRAGDLVRADVRLRSAAFSAIGLRVDLPARATFRVERP